jgi:alpha-tubulin suppressor-like RCC1 family protein
MGIPAKEEQESGFSDYLAVDTGVTSSHPALSVAYPEVHTPSDAIVPTIKRSRHDEGLSIDFGSEEPQGVLSVGNAPPIPVISHASIAPALLTSDAWHAASQHMLSTTTSATQLLHLMAATRARLQQLQQFSAENTPGENNLSQYEPSLSSTSIMNFPTELVRKSMAYSSPADLGSLDCCCRYFRGLTESVAHEQARVVYKRRCLPRRKAESWSGLLNFVALSKHSPTVAAGDFHSMLVTDSGELYSFGSGESGQLGHGDSENQFLPRSVTSFQGVRMACAAGNYGHSLTVTETGQLFSFGDGRDGRLGHGNSRSCSFPKPVMEMSKLRVVTVAAGFDHSMVVTEMGCVYTMGNGEDGKLGHGDTESCPLPRMVSTWPRMPTRMRVVAVAAGGYHSMVLAADGMVATFGNGEDGKLGHGSEQRELMPRVVQTLMNKGVKTRAIAAGDGHSMVVTVQGELYTFGASSYGRSGHDAGTLRDASMMRHIHPHLHPLPTTYQLEDGGGGGSSYRGDMAARYNQQHVARAGGSEGVGSSASSSRVSVWHNGTAGSGGGSSTDGGSGRSRSGSGSGSGSGQDASSQSACMVPKLVGALRGTIIVAVAAGGYHSLALSAAGQLYTFGSGDEGQLGTGNTDSHGVPLVVEALRGVKIAAVTAGGEHTLAVSSKGRVYTFGDGTHGQLGHGNMQRQVAPSLVEALADVKVRVP